MYSLVYLNLHLRWVENILENINNFKWRNVNKIVESLKNSSTLLKGASKTTENETEKQKDRCYYVLL